MAVLQAWPLPLHLATHLTGSPDGDAGVYVWNLWAFRHELLAGHWLPFSTGAVLPTSAPADLSLHNYTVFADLLALPLQPVFGLLTTFNLIYLLNVALAGFGVFVLVRRLTGRVAESWLAGLAFACSPFLATRGAGHYSLAAAAPLPFFVVAFERLWEQRRLRDAGLVALVLAWAAGCDPYYAVYCVLLAGCLAGAHLVTVHLRRTRPTSPLIRRSLDIALLAAGAFVAALVALGGGSIRIGGATVSLHSLYTPVLILAVLALARLWIAWRPRVDWRPMPGLRRILRATGAAIVATAILLAPQLYAMGQLAVTGRLTRAPVGWRSSAPGVDLLSFFIPNPNHPLMPHAVADWLGRRPGGGYEDQVASISYVALIVILIAWRRASFKPARVWLLITLGFASLALGPFVQIAGLATFVPTPWTLLRYIPLIGDARMPSRFDAVVTMGLSVMFGGALAALTARDVRHRRAWLVAIGAALVFELAPIPRPLFAADVPDVYRTIAADPRPVRVLNLPIGIRDGLGMIGNFSPADQYFQTVHGKTIYGGYLSRVPQSARDDFLAVPVLKALSTLSEGRPLTPDLDAEARATADGFLSDGPGYIVIDDRTASPALRGFAIDVLGLTRIQAAQNRELFVPRANRP